MKQILIAAIFTLFAASAFADGGKHGTAKKVDYSKAEETAFGRAADPRKAKRTVKVEMGDQMRFLPAQITVKRGDIVRFLPFNKGQVMHEMVLGTMDGLKQHAEMMKKHPEMEHDEAHMAHMAHVAPGKSGQISWQFTKAGEFYYACLIPGHFEAGMIGKVIVAADQSSAGQSADKPSAAASRDALAEGEVRKVDKEAKKITIKHGPLQNLDMAAMTMVFQVADPAMLERVKPGDKVKFRAEKLGGAYTVTKLQAAK